MKEMYPLAATAVLRYRENFSHRENCSTCDKPIEDKAEVYLGFYYETEGLSVEVFHRTCIDGEST